MTLTFFKTVSQLFCRISFNLDVSDLFLMIRNDLNFLANSLIDPEILFPHGPKPTLGGCGGHFPGYIMLTADHTASLHNPRSRGCSFVGVGTKLSYAC